MARNSKKKKPREKRLDEIAGEFGVDCRLVESIADALGEREELDEILDEMLPPGDEQGDEQSDKD
ncbi:MAG: hypothetical protein ACLFQX_04085 [Candidatus Kapaibacterium sp.]